MEIEKLFNDEKFKEAVKKAESISDLGSILRTNGISVEDSFLETLYSKAQEGELDESALEDVAGGSWSWFWAWLYSAGGGGFSQGGGGGGFSSLGKAGGR